MEDVGVPLLPFDSDDPLFIRGVEVGMMHARLSRDPGPVEATVHDANTEMVLRLAEAHDRDVIAVDLGEGWLAVEFGPVR